MKKRVDRKAEAVTIAAFLIALLVLSASLLLTQLTGFSVSNLDNPFSVLIHK